jgi:hypothetical protein
MHLEVLHFVSDLEMTGQTYVYFTSNVCKMFPLMDFIQQLKVKDFGLRQQNARKSMSGRPRAIKIRIEPQHEMQVSGQDRQLKIQSTGQESTNKILLVPYKCGQLGQTTNFTG